MTDWLQKTVQSRRFQFTILGLIVLAAVLVGLETYPKMNEKYGDTITLLNRVVLYMFVLEALMKMGQHGQHFLRYFRDPWNIFDFTIVAVCFLPLDAQYAAVLRLARIVRALRLVTVMPKLQLLVSALLKSIPSMGYVGVLLFLNFYVYAVMGVFLFRDNDPVHFENLQTAMLTLFRVVTLEDWTDVMYIQMLGSDVYAYSNTTDLPVIPSAQPLVGCFFFVSFVMLGTMIMLNLFIGVILNSMSEAQAEADSQYMRDREKREHISLDDEIGEMEASLEKLQQQLSGLRVRVRDTS